MSPGRYWAAGADVIEQPLRPNGGGLIRLEVEDRSHLKVCEALRDTGATVAILLTGYADPSIGIVQEIRRDRMLQTLTIEAPAGQPELPMHA